MKDFSNPEPVPSETREPLQWKDILAIIAKQTFQLRVPSLRSGRF
jgi:hypothetical protein